MSDPVQLLNALRRPGLLLDAVRHGLQDYRRERVLRRLLSMPVAPGPRRAVSALIAIEEALEESRRARDASYNAARHIEALVALISEVRTLSSEAARAQRAEMETPPMQRAACR